MKGIEISKAYYKTNGKKMLDEEFYDIKQYLAVGLVGSGSECYGFDDKISTDHDFEPGFCIFIPDENIIDGHTEFLLEKAYAKLPKEFMNYKRSIVNPVGGKRKGIIRISDFYKSKTGTEDGILTVEQWLTIPSAFLYEAVNGEIFEDNYGLFTEIRNRLTFYPDDIALKKLAGHLLSAFQSGQYNYERCILHNETASAQLSLYEFTNSILNVIFILNCSYMPYYKWSFRTLRALPLFSELSDSLEYLISTENTKDEIKIKKEVIADISSMIIKEIKKRELSNSQSQTLDIFAYDINNKISDNYIRELNILAVI